MVYLWYNVTVKNTIHCGKYTFSAYVKTSGLTVADGKKGAFLRVTDGTSVYESDGVVNTTANREIYQGDGSSDIYN